MNEDKFSDRHPALFASFVLLLIMVPFFAFVFAVGGGEERKPDELGCYLSTREVYYQCRTEALLRIQIQEQRKLTPNDS